MFFWESGWDISKLLRELKEEEKIMHAESKKFGHWRLA
jgi:hypothetical protein